MRLEPMGDEVVAAAVPAADACTGAEADSDDDGEDEGENEKGCGMAPLPMEDGVGGCGWGRPHQLGKGGMTGCAAMTTRGPPTDVERMMMPLPLLLLLTTLASDPDAKVSTGWFVVIADASTSSFAACTAGAARTLASTSSCSCARAVRNESKSCAGGSSIVIEPLQEAELPFCCALMVATSQWLPTAPMGGEGVEASEASDGAGCCRSCCSVMSERPSAALLTFTFAK